jgi:hypothetical protein
MVMTGSGTGRDSTAVRVTLTPETRRAVEQAAMRSATAGILDAVTQALRWSTTHRPRVRAALAALADPEVAVTLAGCCPLCNGPACGSTCPLRPLRGALATLDPDVTVITADGAADGAAGGAAGGADG